MSKKITKTDLDSETVESNSFHVGIELELKANGEDNGGHDSDACYESQESYMSDLGAEGIMRDYMDLSRDQARSVAPYFDVSQWVSDYMQDWNCDGDCGNNTEGDGDSVRSTIETELTRLTGNASIKVVSDSSISTGSDEIDAEVCWNYYASKETIKDNAKILKYLRSNGATFDKSCGLHINLNNYLNIDDTIKIATKEFDFLFKFVASSRANSSYCRNYAMSGTEKYSMIYNQGDRLEFRFFSPTLDPVKLNHYVALANVVYRRLAGKEAKLSKKTMIYFLDKMVKVNGVSESDAIDAIKSVNSIKNAYCYNTTPYTCATKQYAMDYHGYSERAEVSNLDSAVA